jgi:hypothetical protein
MILLAHHLEAQHVPVLAALFTAGFFVGWQVVSRWLSRRSAATPGRSASDTGHDNHS